MKSVNQLQVPGHIKLRMVACKDIWNAATQVFLDPEKYSGKTISSISCNASREEEVAAILSCVSSELCKYSLVMPKWAMRLLFPNLA